MAKCPVFSQQIQFCTTDDGVKLAYSLIGKGTPVVRASHWLSHLEYDLDSPVWRHVVLGMAHNHTLLRYDARGTGLSQRDVADKEISLDRWVKDLGCVVDAAGLDKFVVLGISQGAAISVAYAARHQDRVSRLILYGGYARGHLHRDSPDAVKQYEVRRTMVAAGWGSEQDAYRKWFALSFIPGGTAEQSQWFADLERISASPAVAERLVEAVANIDVRGELPNVNVPTLVLHCRDDQIAPMSLGQEYAAGIKQARFVPLEGKNHLFLANGPAHRAFFAAVNEFLGDPPMKGALPGTERPDRVDAAVKRIEQNWAIKVICIIAAVLGVIAFLIDFLRH